MVTGVCEVLQDVADRWYEIGKTVGLDMAMLEGELKGKNPVECLAHVVGEWKEWSWEKVIQILKELGKNEQAKVLAREKGM